MDNRYIESAGILKAIAEPNRLRILNMLSDGELCACKILDRLVITQPTLSHHMRILCDCGIVDARKSGKWMHYSLNHEKLKDLENMLINIRKPRGDRAYQKHGIR